MKTCLSNEPSNWRYVSSKPACRGKSTADVIAKLRIIVEEEADESAYWMELLIESGLLPEARVSDLLQESNEIIANDGSVHQDSSEARWQFSVKSAI